MIIICKLIFYSRADLTNQDYENRRSDGNIHIRFYLPAVQIIIHIRPFDKVRFDFAVLFFIKYAHEKFIIKFSVTFVFSSAQEPLISRPDRKF